MLAGGRISCTVQCNARSLTDDDLHCVNIIMDRVLLIVVDWWWPV